MQISTTQKRSFSLKPNNSRLWKRALFFATYKVNRARNKNFLCCLLSSSDFHARLSKLHAWRFAGIGGKNIETLSMKSND